MKQRPYKLWPYMIWFELNLVLTIPIFGFHVYQIIQPGIDFNYWLSTGLFWGFLVNWAIFYKLFDKFIKDENRRP